MPVCHQHWIAGKADAPASGNYLPTIDPTTRRPGDEIAAGTSVDVDRAVAAAADAQPGWARTSGAERSEALHRVADAIERGADELMALERACTGKLPGQLRLEVDMSAAYFRYYAGTLRTVGGRTIDHGAGTHTYTRLEPYGVVAAIIPWNLPLNQACRALAPALAVGNAVVAKPSELTSTSTLQLARLATEVVASVWSGDVARGLRVAERIDAGQVAVNGGALTIETPFGGVKQSGYGREKGIEALHDYALTKTISLSLH